MFYRAFSLLLVVALVLVAAKFAHAQAPVVVDANTYCESCDLGSIELDFGSFVVRASGLVEDEDGVHRGSGVVSGSPYAGPAEIAVVFVDNPNGPAGEKWVDELLVSAKGFALVSTSAGAEQFPGPIVQNRIVAEYVAGAPGRVKKWTESSAGALKGIYRGR